MKGLSRVFLGINTSRRLLRITKLTGLPKKLDISAPESSSIVRLKSTRTFEGPGLKDFLINDSIAKNEFITQTPEHIPYLDELDLHGNDRKVYFEVQGCQMNSNDAEIVWSILQKSGYEKTTILTEAHVVLIVTCAIRDSAESKIWFYLRELNAFRRQTGRKDMKIGILGCMAERLKSKVLEIDKTVDLVAGPDSYKDLPRLLALTRCDQKAVNVLLSLDETYADVMPVRLNENKITAFVSIMRGCDNMCTYCIVPFTRGRERSRPITSILDEVKMLSEQGIKQITLLGQNVNSYRDTSYGVTPSKTKMSAGFKTVYKMKEGGLRFDVLLDKVSEIDPNMRIRFTSPHPKDFPDEVLYLIKERKNICCNLVLPAQSGSTVVLERMRRGYTREAYIELVEHIRSIIPNMSFATDIITGFCGETEKDHEDTLDLLRVVKYNFVYFFPYSMREKTTAHRRYVDDVPKEVKKRRLLEIYNVFREISRELNKNQIGQKQLILVEGFSKKSQDFLEGRNDGNTKVIIPNCDVPSGVNSTDMKSIKPGDYIAVSITESNSQTLKGNPLHHTRLEDFEDGQSIGRIYDEEKVSV